MEWAVPRARSNSLSHSDGRDLSVDVLLAQHAMVMESQKSRAQELMNKLRNVSAAHLNTLEPSRAEAAVKKSGSVDPAHSHSHSQLQSQPQLQSQTQAQAQAQVQAQAQAQAQAQDKFLFQRRQQPVPKFKIAETAGYGWQRSERRGDMARGIGAGRRTPAPPSEFEAGAASSEQRFSVFESKFVDLNAEMDQTNELSDDSLGGGDAETAVNPSRAFHKEWIDEASAPRLPVQPSEAMIRAQRILEKFATKSPHSMNSEHDVTTSHADFDHIRKVDSQSAPQAHAERELLASSDSDKTKFPKSARTARAVAKLPPVPTLTWVKSLFRAQDRLKTGCVGVHQVRRAMRLLERKYPGFLLHEHRQQLNILLEGKRRGSQATAVSQRGHGIRCAEVFKIISAAHRTFSTAVSSQKVQANPERDMLRGIAGFCQGNRRLRKARYRQQRLGLRV